MTRLSPAVTVAVALALGAAGCKDQEKRSVKGASEDAAWVADLATRDVEELERGLPVGAKSLADMLEKSPEIPKDPALAKSALIRMRQKIPDLNVAKSTFFALADPSGVAIRNNLEQDAMAGQDLVAVFPELKKAVGGDFVTTTGSFPGAATQQGPDKTFVAAVPIKSAAGAIEGLLVTGWAYRSFAYHLQETLRTHLMEKTKQGGDYGKLPVFYVAVFDGSGVYSSPSTPPVNEKALADLGLVDKTSAGPYQGTTTVTNRTFGVGAVRVPKLGENAGVAVLRSDL